MQSVSTWDDDEGWADLDEWAEQGGSMSTRAWVGPVAALVALVLVLGLVFRGFASTGDALPGLLAVGGFALVLIVAFLVVRKWVFQRAVRGPGRGSDGPAHWSDRR